MTADETLAEIDGLFARHGAECYGEEVTMAEHALLTAQAAQDAGADDALVVAALLHDLGHFLAGADDDFGHHDHGETAASYLRSRFPAAVVEPVRLHIEAKRYLCAVEPGYHELLSAASQYTLTKQGGAMSPAEVAAFEQQPFWQDAVRLRRWEDMTGKISLESPAMLADFAPLVRGQHL